MLPAVLCAGAPVANEALPQRDKGIARSLRRVRLQTGAAKQRTQFARIRKRLVHALLQGPTCTSHNSRSPSQLTKIWGASSRLTNAYPRRADPSNLRPDPRKDAASIFVIRSLTYGKRA